MALDLASSYSPFKNPLFVLASIASKELRNEINETKASEVKLSNGVKKHVKKSTCVLTLDDIRSLPAKSLLDKFAEMRSDEITKKYSYKCVLLPEKCTTTYKSFGNEKKACDEMKSHLQSHVSKLILEQEANRNVFDVLFFPKSPNSSSKQIEKISKKSVKKQQISLQISKTTSPSSSRTNIYKRSRKERNTETNVKKFKSKLHSNKKNVTEKKNGIGKDKNKMFNSVYLEKNGLNEDSNDDSYQSEQESVLKNLDEEYVEDQDVDNDVEFCSNYSEHLKKIFFSNYAAKEKLSESEGEQDDDSKSNDFSSLPDKDNNNLSTSCSTNSDQSFMVLQDHNYVSNEEVKDTKPPGTNIKYEDPFSDQENAQTALVIRTPPFPFIHIPLLPEVAEIIEIGEVECFCGAEECSRFSNSSSDASIVKNEVEEVQNEEHMDFISDGEEKYSSAFPRMNGASSSVLECVDNIVNNKPSSSCVPMNEIPANENDENLNTQKFEKEFALKCIAKLHSKGKKKISDSLVCQICTDKHFTAQATLIHHYRSHAGIKPYVCEICSAKFTRQHSLNYHMLIHKNLSRFTCDFCGRTFRHPSHFREHLRRHTGETPYHCTECNLHFKTRNTFKRHLKTRHSKLLTATGIEDLGNK